MTSLAILQGLAEGQVLQRQGSRGATVKISGTASAPGRVLATLTGAKAALKGWESRPIGKSAQGRFSAVLQGIPAGGPYRLTLHLDKETGPGCRIHFYVGDVWLLAGQSNMEGVGNMASPAKPHPLIRVFSMRREWRLATDPLHLMAESPDACHHGTVQVSREEGEKLRRTVRKGVGVGIFFARDMLKRTGIPQGLLATAHGGTSMSQWDPATGEMYHSMLASVRATGQPVAGVLWYQGESDSDAANAPLYAGRMQKLVAGMRREFRQPDLPWVIVQISRVLDARVDPCWNSIQESQRLLPGKIRRFETVSAIDLPLDDNIHIGADAFPLLGSRLATAMRYLNGDEKLRPPHLLKIVPPKSMLDPVIDVVFGSVQRGLRSDGLPQGFSLVNAEGKSVPSIYRTTLHGNIARLHCGAPTVGLSVHYGFGRAPVCNITDGRNLALPAFGPVPLSKPMALLPFVQLWKTSGLLPASQPLKQITCPDLEALGGTAKTYSEGIEGFINERAIWKDAPGHHYFSSVLELSEPMKLRFLMGYDGPFRVWVDDAPFFRDLNGTNPAVRDQSRKSLALAAGRHRVTVAMDTHHGMAWGFFLRFVREDLTAAQIKSGIYAVPAYSV